MAHATLTPEVETVLRASTITDNLLVLPAGQLERKLYEAVNKVIVNCGGKWNRSAKGHIFSSDPRAKLGIALDTGVAEDTKKTLQAFYTPSVVAARVVELAEVNGYNVLEPSAGEGALVKEALAQGAKSVECIEINEECRQKLIGPGRMVQIADFLTVEPDYLFERIIANPPFTRGTDLRHLVHMLRFLASPGICVCVMAPTTPDKPAFKKALEGYTYTVEEVDAGAFRESGTNIRTVIVKVIAP